MNTQNVNYVPNNMRKLYVDACKALTGLEGKQPSVFDMMAICWTATLGEYFYDCQNCLMKKRLKELEEVTGVKTWEFLNALRCGKGINSHRLPRFVFDAGAFFLVKSWNNVNNLSDVQMAIASCGIGIATRWHTDLVRSTPGDDLMLYLNEFKRSEMWQLQTLASDLVAAGGADAHAEPEVFRRFYGDKLQAQANVHHAQRVAALSRVYSAFWEEATGAALADGAILNLNEVSVKTQ